MLFVLVLIVTEKCVDTGKTDTAAVEVDTATGDPPAAVGNNGVEDTTTHEIDSVNGDEVTVNSVCMFLL
ncbi:hypothetical protein JG688_00000223 [Phytophthora aleatoria]|uniref:Uncharacterized protein n=1 Tax=Phytophthora aleatoria TaxID=2496075 RepID=A0A8J5JEC8_9STRA|nr:hypothetical protein JG688_00000223 [Phytophthora aleatoria]